MSLILDALKKSENERQQQSSAEFSSVPTGSADPNPLRWLWMLGFLLAVNFAILLGILWKTSSSDDEVAVEVADEPAAAVTAPASTSSFEEQVAVAIDNRAAETPAPTPPVEEPTVTTTPEPAPTTSSRVTEAPVPTIDELRLQGTLQIAQLHLDIHVYSEVPEERFVFINMNKHREGAQTPEGPVVREIRTDGVLLEHQGRVFLLPRQ